MLDAKRMVYSFSIDVMSFEPMCTLGAEKFETYRFESCPDYKAGNPVIGV